MSLLVRATELTGRPVVTLAGEDVAQIKDVVYDGSGGVVSGFTLNGRGVFAGPLKVSLPWASVAAFGRDAVMIPDEGVLVKRNKVVPSADIRKRNVLGDRVVTDAGADIGKVVDVILQVGAVAEVAGYEVQANPALRPNRQRVLIPLPDTVAVSGEALIVPAEALEFVSDDLSGFGAAVATFRARLEGQRRSDYGSPSTETRSSPLPKETRSSDSPKVARSSDLPKAARSLFVAPPEADGDMAAPPEARVPRSSRGGH